MIYTRGFFLFAWLIDCDCNSTGGCDKCRIIPYIMTTGGEIGREMRHHNWKFWDKIISQT